MVTLKQHQWDRMNKQIPIWICIFILLAFAVCAVKPATQLSSNVEGLGIEFPRYNTHEQNTYYHIHTHVINLSDGIIITNETTKCFIHLYNISGSHIMEEYMGWDSNGLEFELYIGAGNFSNLGDYAYIIQCNGTSGGGFVGGNFEITEDGKDMKVLSDTTSSVSITIFILVIMFLILYAGLTQDFTSNLISNLIIKRGLIAVGIYLMVLNSAIMATFANVSNLGVANEMFRYMWLFGIAGYIALLVLVFKTMLDIIQVYKEEQVKMRLGE